MIVHTAPSRAMQHATAARPAHDTTQHPGNYTPCTSFGCDVSCGGDSAHGAMLHAVPMQLPSAQRRTELSCDDESSTSSPA